ncbi:MAG: DUF3052 domain-containing protein [Devosia sp.]|jgi:hypothetical protein|nr:DUF3052 domain-containing protein [Devosia sp.]
MTAAAGYSGTPLAQKLGLKDGQRVLFVGLPRGELFLSLFTAAKFAEAAEIAWDRLEREPFTYDVIHGFVDSRAALETNAQHLMAKIERNGMIWISWPKKASKVPTDVTEDVIRDVVLPLGLVDIKVVAVNDVWSGLKLMIRKELRQGILR